MTKVQSIKKGISDKLQKIEDKDFLLFLEEIIGSYSATNTSSITKEQEEMLRLSEEDVKYGRTITQEDLQDKTSKWLQKRKA